MAAESKLEQWAREQAAARGCKLVKWVSPGNKGVHDRIFFGRKGSGYIAFLEFKAPGKKPSELQDWWLDYIRDVGFPSTWISTKADFLKILIEEEARYDARP
jgi:hypothetical protein